MLWAERRVFGLPQMSRDDRGSLFPKYPGEEGWEDPEKPPAGLGPAVLTSERSESKNKGDVSRIPFFAQHYFH